MKTLYLLFVILITCCYNLFGQYYIGQDKIDQLKNSENKSYVATGYNKNKDYKVYLEGAGQHYHTSDVKIGFDKLKYERGETVTLTFSRTGNNPNVENETIMIVGNNRITADFKIDSSNSTYIFQLRPNEIKKIFVHLDKKGGGIDRISVGIGKFGAYGESRNYVISHPPLVKEGSNSNKTIELRYEGAKSGLKKKLILNKTAQTVNISGTVQFKDIFTNDYKPVKNFIMDIYEGETIEDFQFINRTQELSITTDENGNYSANIDINNNYYAVSLTIARKEPERFTYFVGHYNGTTVVQSVPVSPITSMDSSLQFSYTYEDTTGIMEQMRKCAYIASRIDLALTKPVGGDNLNTIQTLLIGVDSSYKSAQTKIFSVNDKTNLMRIGTSPAINQNYTLRDGVIFHEYGHSLANALADFTINLNATGGHYIDQKSNTNLAFSEGWADFWACTVLNDEDLYDQAPYNFQLDLSDVDRDYIYSVTSLSTKNTYLPNSITIYDGPENEALIAATFWKLKGSGGLSAVWNAMKSTVDDGTNERAVQNMLEYFAENNTLKNSFYSDADRAEELGFGRNFSYLNASNNLASSIPSLSDKTLIYLQNGSYTISSPIVINGKSFGIYGMSLAKTILHGQANQNIISITNPNNDDNWNKISDMKFVNSKFSVEVQAPGNYQPKLYISRCYSTTGINGLSLAGDAILFNNVFANNLTCGLLINSKGSDREIYIYNNVIENCGIGLRFNNSQSIDISGYISNNIFYNNNTGLALVDSGAGAAGTRHGLNFTYNAQYPYTISVSTGLNIANNIDEEPTYTPFSFYEAYNTNYLDGGLNIEQTYPDEAIFKDLFEEGIYGNFRNWIGFWGGRQSYNNATILGDSKITINPASLVVGQNVWSGFVYIDSSTTINSGASVTTIPGTEIIFSSGTSLIANGVLSSTGNTNQSVLFKPESGTSPSSWGTIKLNGSGASGSVIKYANISYGTEVDVYNVPDFEISNCNFTDNYKAVYVNNSTGLISNNYLTSNSIGHSILIENASTVDCIQNIIKKTSPNERRGSGIQYGGGSNGNVWQNDITDCNWGIGAIWSSSPNSYNSGSFTRNNRVTDCDYGIMVYRESYPIFGTPSSNLYALNSFHDNTKNVSVGNYYTSYASSLTAFKNWWGDSPPDTSLFSVGPNAQFIYTLYRSSDPWSGIPLPLIMDSPENTKGEPGEVIAKMQSANNEISAQETNPLMNGINLRHQNKYKEAKDFFISYLAEHPEDQRAYVELYNCYSKETANDLINFFTKLPTKASKDHKLLLSYLYLKESRNNSKAEREKFISLAENKNNEIIEENPNTSLSVRAKINNIYIALFSENNLQKALNIFAEIADKTQSAIGGSTERELSDVEDAIEIYAGTFKGGSNNSDSPKIDKDITSLETPKEYSLLGNYPNPFNPSTTISYNLPFISEVEVTIYDILGSEIKSFIFPFQNSGTQKIIWNGRNSNGEQVSSGIYLYHFKAKSLEKNNEVFEKSAKLILMK